MTLTAKQATFCKEYVVDFNATQGATRAGYSPRTANEQGARLLAKASVQVEIRRLIDERAKRVEVDADFVVRMLVENVQRSMQAVAVVDAEGNPIGEYRYNGAVANKSLELLGRHLGMFTDRQEIEHSVRPEHNFLGNLLAQVEATRRNQVIDGAIIADAEPGRLEHTPDR